MKTGEEIRQAIRSIVAQYLVTTTLRAPKLCKVLKVNASPSNGPMTCDCKPNDRGPIVQNVKLVANYSTNKAGFVLVPKANSMVQVSFNNEGAAFISMVSEVDFVYLNGNDYGGLVQVQPLVDKINALENLVNDLILKYNTHTHPVSGSATTTPLPVFIENNNITPTTQKADLENTTVLHGTGNLS